jgi:hypothetical protein
MGNRRVLKSIAIADTTDTIVLWEWVSNHLNSRNDYNLVRLNVSV